MAPTVLTTSLNLVDYLLVAQGMTDPPLLAQVTYGGAQQDMAGVDDALFFMRPLLSREPVIDGASAYVISPPDAFNNNIGYAWASEDVAVEGQYMGWFRFTRPGDDSPSEIGEFPILVTDHGPGHGTQTGVVVDGVAQFMPTTFQALRDHPTFGDRMLQRFADRVKRQVLGVAVGVDEESAYDPLLVDYLSKATAVALITPGREYWARQHKTVTTQTPVEIAAYPDMLAALDALDRRLRCELAQDWRQLRFLVPGLPVRRVQTYPVSSLGDPSVLGNGPVTRSPQETQRLQTGHAPFRGLLRAPWGFFL